MHRMLKTIAKYIASKQARQTPPSPPKDWETLRSAIHGWVSITDGQLSIQNPEHYGAYATIIIPENQHLQVFVNDCPVVGEVVLAAHYKVDIQLTRSEPTVYLESSISTDKLAVHLSVRATPGQNWRLKDSPPTRRLVLALVAIQESDEEIPVVSEEEIRAHLRQRGLTGQEDERAIRLLCSGTSTSEVVLRGQAPFLGRPRSYRELHLATEVDELIHKTRLSPVTTGTVLADADCGIAPRPGRDVFGEEIPVGHLNPVHKMGQGVIQVNQHVVAACDGRPMFTKHHIEVLPEYYVEGDICADHKETHFDGNVVVHGSILEGVRLEASGSVIVSGNVIQATVIANHDIYVCGTVNSAHLEAGHSKYIRDAMAMLVQRLTREVEMFHTDYLSVKEQVMKRFDAYSVLPRVPIILLENHHSALAADAERFTRDFNKERTIIANPKYMTIHTLLNEKWQGKNRSSLSDKESELLLKTLQDYETSLQTEESRVALIHVQSVTSSTLAATGNIIVAGKGCASSTLESQRTISIHGSLRGGFAVANRSIYVTELGNEYGMETSVRVADANGFVRATVRHPNTLIQVGHSRDVAYTLEQNVRIRGGFIYENTARR